MEQLAQNLNSVPTQPLRGTCFLSIHHRWSGGATAPLNYSLKGDLQHILVEELLLDRRWLLALMTLRKELSLGVSQDLNYEQRMHLEVLRPPQPAKVPHPVSPTSWESRLAEAGAEKGKQTDDGGQAVSLDGCVLGDDQLAKSCSFSTTTVFLEALGQANPMLSNHHLTSASSTHDLA